MVVFACPNDKDDGKKHRVKWNSGNQWCLTCNVAAVIRYVSDSEYAAIAARRIKEG